MVVHFMVSSSKVMAGAYVCCRATGVVFGVANVVSWSNSVSVHFIRVLDSSRGLQQARIYACGVLSPVQVLMWGNLKASLLARRLRGGVLWCGTPYA